MIMEIIGKSPISMPVFVIGKIALMACSLFFIVKILKVDRMLYDSAFTRTVGVILYVIGLSMVIVSLLQLGRSLAVGIPERSTELQTHGMYGFTRNPAYLGAFINCAGSCLFSIHFINFLLFAIAVVVHVRIVTKEEEFLEERFGQRWLDYKQRVPRFIGTIRGSNSDRSSV